MSNLSTVIDDNQSHLKGATFHFKTYAIILFVLGGLLCLAGLPLLILLGLGIIYIALGVLYVFLGLNMMKASQSIKNIIGVSELTQDDYNTNSMNVIVELKKHFKVLNIMMAVALGFSLIAGIAFAAFLPSIYKEIEKNSSMINGSYNNSTLPRQPNPYQTQSNKSLTATQMGMSDKEHEEMHDPKNIVNTDYSQLDYGNAADELKASQDAMKNAMDKMTPEQKAAMEKAMSNLKN
jgi:hypothetical protein